MKIEADRLGRGLILDEERQPEMSVVRNEYEIGENNPGEALSKAVIGTAITAHPYHWDPIGYRSDIEGVSTDKLREHYKNFFWPNNAEAILVGDFDTAKALAMFENEYGSFPTPTKPIPEVITVEPPQEGERRVVVKRPGQAGSSRPPTSDRAHSLPTSCRWKCFRPSLRTGSIRVSIRRSSRRRRRRVSALPTMRCAIHSLQFFRRPSLPDQRIRRQRTRSRRPSTMSPLTA